jgi:hypothetical protein
VSTATDAAEIGLSLAETYAGDDLLSDVRVALAIGPVLVKDGDFYGPVVNLASRLVGVANPGTVLVSDEFRAAMSEEGGVGFDMRALRTRYLKDIGRVQVWKLSRAGSAPGAERSRNVRWDRLNEVLRELDDLRDRGEHLVVRGSRRDLSEAGADADAESESGEGASAPVEAERGDAVGPELEAPLEGGDR